MSVGRVHMRSVWRARTRSKHSDTPDTRMLIVWPHAKRLARAQALEDELARLRKQLSETEEQVQALKRALSAKEQEKKMKGYQKDIAW